MLIFDRYVKFLINVEKLDLKAVTFLKDSFKDQKNIENLDLSLAYNKIKNIDDLFQYVS